MESVQIVAYSENSFSIPQWVNEEMLKDKQVAVNINSLLRYKDGADALGCQIRVLYTADNKTVMEYAAVLTVLIAGWAEMIKKNPEKDEIVAASKGAWAQTIDFVRGAICVNATKSGNELVARFILPTVDIDKFLPSIAIEKVA